MGDKVFARVAPYKYVIRFDKKVKLTSRFIGPFEVLKCISKIAYQLTLPVSMDHIHNMFHVLLLRKYINNLIWGCQT